MSYRIHIASFHRHCVSFSRPLICTYYAKSARWTSFLKLVYFEQRRVHKDRNLRTSAALYIYFIHRFQPVQSKALPARIEALELYIQKHPRSASKKAEYRGRNRGKKISDRMQNEGIPQHPARKTLLCLSSALFSSLLFFGAKSFSLLFLVLRT